MEEIENQLRSLLKGEFSSLHIGFNDEHACNYCTAQRYADEYGDYEMNYMWIDEEDRALALATNSVWSAQWYPDTPVGFCRKYASSLPKLLNYLFTIKE